MSDTFSFRLGSVCSRFILVSHCPEGPVQLPDFRRDECFRRSDFSRWDHRRIPVESGACRELGGDGARHGIAPHAPHALHASPHASPAPHAHASHAGVHLDVRAHALSTHAHSPHGTLTPQAAGPTHALQHFWQPASGHLSVLAESAPSGALGHACVFVCRVFLFSAPVSENCFRGSSPPSGGAVGNKRVVILHDGFFRYHNNNTMPKSDGYGNISDDLNRAFSEVFKIGISCESEYIAPSDQDTCRVALSEMVEAVKAKVEQARLANRASSTIIVVFWSFQEACKLDQSCITRVVWRC